MMFSLNLQRHGILYLFLLDFDPGVHFYWRRGERIIPKGHRRGHLEPTRFQINDRPNSQIRITQQLQQVHGSERTAVAFQSSMFTLIKVGLYLKPVTINHVCVFWSLLSLSRSLSRFMCAHVCSSPPWKTRMRLKSQRSHWHPTSCLSLDDSMTTTSLQVNVETPTIIHGFGLTEFDILLSPRGGKKQYWEVSSFWNDPDVCVGPLDQFSPGYSFRNLTSWCFNLAARIGSYDLTLRPNDAPRTKAWESLFSLLTQPF